MFSLALKLNATFYNDDMIYVSVSLKSAPSRQFPIHKLVSKHSWWPNPLIEAIPLKLIDLGRWLADISAVVTQHCDVDIWRSYYDQPPETEFMWFCFMVQEKLYLLHKRRRRPY